jgi:hypothetical protein
MDDVNLKSIILMMLCVSIVLYLFDFQLLTFGDNDKNFIETFVDVPESDYQDITLSGNVSVAVQQMTQPSSGFLTGAISAIIDVLKLLAGFLVIMANIALAPIALIYSITGIPYQVAIMIGIPILVAYVLALVYFIRGLN